MASQIGEVSKNVNAALEFLEEAAARGVDLAVLPEFSTTGFFAQVHDYRQLELAESEEGETVSAFRDAGSRLGINIVATLFEETMAGIRYNTAFLIGSSGEIVGRYRKVHPAAVPDNTRDDWPTNGDFEKLYVRPGSDFGVWPVGDLRVGIMICYDHFHPEAARCLTLNGAELIVGPFAAVEANEDRTWETVMACRALENGVYIAPCNQVGTASGLTFGGSSLVVDPFGNVLARASSTEEEILVVDVNRAQVELARAQFPILRDRVPSAYTSIVSP